MGRVGEVPSFGLAAFSVLLKMLSIPDIAALVAKTAVFVPLLAAIGVMVPIATATAQTAESPSNETAADNTSGTSPSPTADQIEAWIGELGDDSFLVRQAAADQLLAGGAAARETLLSVVDAPDPETRAAARRLVTLIEQAELDRRLAEFAADVDGRRGATLPGWAEFGELVGTDKAARTMFVEMQRYEASLLAKVFGNAPRGDDTNWEERLFQLQNWQVAGRERYVAPSLGSCATMLFLATSPNSGVSERGAIVVTTLARRSPIREAVIGKERQVVVRRLVLAWVNDCPLRNDRTLTGRLALMLQYELTEALPMALAVARGESPFLTASAHNRLAAILAVGRFGSAANADDLEPILSDDTICMTVGLPAGARSVQLRDVALATMIHLTGQRAEDYGFGRVQRHPQSLYNPRSLGMRNDQQRAAAAAKWRAWKADSDASS